MDHKDVALLSLHFKNYRPGDDLIKESLQRVLNISLNPMLVKEEAVN
jgi:hypothetical protein